MAGPWERYAPQTATESGPWGRYERQPGKPSAEDIAMADPTRGNSFLGNAAIGLGKMMYDTGRGVKQLVTGNSNQADIDEAKKLDAPLMNTAGGNVGHIGGNVGLALLPGGALSLAGRALPAAGAAGRAMLASPATLGGLATGFGMGATQSFIQPVASDESRGAKTLIGGVAGGAVPLLGMGAGMAKSALEPLYAAGRDKIVGRAMLRATGSNSDDAIRNLSGGGALVPGSEPTAAQVAGSPGLAALQRSAAAVDPEAYGHRAAAQNQARVEALQGLAGTERDRALMGGVRSMMTELPYSEATSAAIPKDLAAAMKPQIDSLMRRPAMRTAVERAKDIFAEEDVALIEAGSPRGLQLAKQALDDIIEKAGSPSSSIGKNQLRALQQTRSDLISTMGELTPKLREADAAYAQWSRPLNQMGVAEEISSRSINPLTGQLQPQAYARALSDDSVVRATGRGAATLENTMDPSQLAMLNAIRDDLASSVAAQNMGRGAGSDTVQKLAMTNLMQGSGLPVGILGLPGIGRLGNWAYSNSDAMMKQRLADILLNPNQAAGVMRGAMPNATADQILMGVRATAAPLLLGTGTSVQSR